MKHRNSVLHGMLSYLPWKVFDDLVAAHGADKWVRTLSAVRIQVAVALIAFLLLRLAHAGQKAVPDLLAFVRSVRVHLLHRRDINALDGPETPPEIDPRQLSLGGCLA